MRLRRLLNKLLRPLGLRLEKLPDVLEFPLYPEARRPAQPRYLNIGALDFSHPFWHKMDDLTPWDGFSRRQEGNVDFPHDLLSGQPLPIASDTLAIAYCSHVVEHLRDQDTQLLFKEVRRALKPGGIFRLVAPDMEVFYAAYLRSDALLFRSGVGLYECPSLEQKLLMQCASSLVMSHPASGTRKYGDAEIRALFASRPRDEVFESLCAQASIEIQKQFPADHINWFTPEKTAAMLNAAGFSSVTRSAYGQSSLPILRNTRLFDPYADHSLYFECVK